MSIKIAICDDRAEDIELLSSNKLDEVAFHLVGLYHYTKSLFDFK